jgi:Family of unknown function (DUF6152)
MSIRKYWMGLVSTAAIALPVLAHHSDAGVDMESVVAFEGTVREFTWRNPHVYVIVDVEQNGEPPIAWELQMAAVTILSRRGWTSETLTPGDRVSVRANPAEDGRRYGILQSVEKEGGLALAAAAKAPDVTPSTTTLAGNWLTDRATVQSYPGGFDGFFHALLKLNDNGKVAKAAFSVLSDENPDASCVGRPTPSALVSTNLYLMEIDLTHQNEVIVLRSERFNEIRTVYMDGRPHPDPNVRFATGHAIGRWDGDTLVIDTANFADHRSPYQIGVPSGGQKHVVERYRLSEDGTHIDVELTLDDPEYLSEPLVHSRQLIYSPHLEMLHGDCDQESTSRFLAD